MDYYSKYLKYKNKYLKLKLLGGVAKKKSLSDIFTDYDELFSLTNENKSLIEQKNSSILDDKSLIEQKNSSILDDKSLIEQKNSLILDGGGKSRKSWEWINDEIFSDETISIKISSLSDGYSHDPTEKYAGIICWHDNQDEEIENIHNTSIRSIYVIIQNTRFWEDDAFSAQGHGFVHDHLFQLINDESPPESTLCSSGFSITNNRVKYSSRWLNAMNYGKPKCRNVNNKSMNLGEIFLTNEAIKIWDDYGVGSSSQIDNRPKYSKSNVMDPDCWAYADEVIKEGHAAIIYS